MKRFKVTDASGNTIVLEGDSEPTEDELREIFESRFKDSATPNGSESARKLVAAGLPEGMFEQGQSFLDSMRGPRESVQFSGDHENVYTHDTSREGREFDIQQVEAEADEVGGVPGIITRAVSAGQQDVQDALDVGGGFVPGTLPSVISTLKSAIEGDLIEEVGGARKPPGAQAQVLAGLQNLGAGVAGSFADPINAATMLASGGAPQAARLVDAAFGAHMAAQIPENIASIFNAETPYELTTSIGGLGLNAGIGLPLAYKGGRHLKNEAMKYTPTGRADTAAMQSDAVKVQARRKLVQKFDDISEQPQTPENIEARERLKAEIEDAGLVESHQQAIDEIAGELDAPVKVVWGRDRSELIDPNQIMTIGSDGRTIEVLGERVGDWLASVPPSRRQALLRAKLRGEEQVHLQTSPEDALAVGMEATPSDIAMLKRKYGSDLELKDIPGETPEARAAREKNRARNLGYELIRFKVAQAEKMTPGEFLEMTTMEKLGVKTLDAMNSALDVIQRRVLNSKAAKSRKEKMDAAVERVRENIRQARPAAEAREGAGPAAVSGKSAGESMADDLGLKWEGELRGRWMFSAINPKDGQPITFGIRENSTPDQIRAKSKMMLDSFVGSAPLGSTTATSKAQEIASRPRGSTTADEIASLSNEDAANLFTHKNAAGEQVYQPQYDAVFFGIKEGEAAIPKLTEMQKLFGKQASDAFKANDIQGMQAAMSKNMWASAAIEGAKRQGGNYKSALEIANQRGELPDFAKMPAAIRRTADEIKKESHERGLKLFGSFVSEMDANNKANAVKLPNSDSYVSVFYNTTDDRFEVYTHTAPDTAADRRRKHDREMIQNPPKPNYSLNKRDSRDVEKTIREARRFIKSLKPNQGIKSELQEYFQFLWNTRTDLVDAINNGAPASMVEKYEQFIDRLDIEYKEMNDWYIETGPDQTSFPAALHRKKPSQQEGQMVLPAWPVARGEQTPDRSISRESAYEQITPNALESVARESLVKDIPSFDDFMANARVRFGSELNREQLVDMWQNSLTKHLQTAGGSELSRLVDSLQLRKSVGRAIIPDAASDAPSVEAAKADAIARATRMSVLADKVENDARLIEGQRGVNMTDKDKFMVSQFRMRAAMLRRNADAIVSEARKGVGLKMDQPTLGLFQASEPGSSPTMLDSPAQRARARAISAIFNKLGMQAAAPVRSWNRKDVSVDDLQWGRGRDAFTEVSPDDMDSLTVLGRSLTDGARSDATTVQTGGGGTRLIHRKGVPESVTKRLTVLLDNRDNSVHVVSTYRHGRQGAVLLDPRFRRDVHRPLEKIVGDYRPVYSMLLASPVRNFYKKFASLGEFNDAIGKAALERVDQSRYGEHGQYPVESFMAEGTEALEGEGGFVTGPDADVARAVSGMVSGALESGVELTPNEARIAYQAFSKMNSAQDAAELIADLAARAAKRTLSPADWNLINAMRKVNEALVETHRHPDSIKELRKAGLPEYTDQQIADLTLEELYALAKKNSTEESFVRSTAQKFTQGLPDVDAPVPAEGSGKELTLPINRRPPTAVSEGNVPPGSIPEKATPNDSESDITERFRRRAVEYARRQKARPAQPGVGEKAWMGISKAAREGHAEAAREMLSERSSNQGPAAIGIRKNVPAPSELIRSAGSIYDQWMVDRIERMGGDASAQGAAAIRSIVDRSKELYGDLTPYLDSARDAAGGAARVPLLGQTPNARDLRASNWMHGLEKVLPFAATSRTVGAMEGSIPVPDYARNLVTLADRANRAIGQTYQLANPSFTPSGLFQRNMTATGVDAIRRGSGDMWRKWTAGLAKANKIPLTEVRQYFMDMKSKLDEPGIDATIIEKINQDFARRFPSVITHVKSSGSWQPVIHSDLFNYLENAAQRAAHVAAFREVFPNTQAGSNALSSLMDDMKRELPPEGQRDLTAVMRALQGHPTDDFSGMGLLAPTESGGTALRMFNQTVGNIFAKMVLSGQMFRQPGELISGAAPQFLGYKNYLRGLARIKELYPQLEISGAVNRVMYDFSFDPNSPIRSASRIAGNTISKVFMEQMFNELQEAAAAATAHVVAERIQSGSLSAWERRMLPETMSSMGFPDAEVRAIMSGDAALLNQFKRKASAFLTSGNRAIAEGSRIGANRLVNSVFRFQSYPMMKANQFRKVATRFAEAWESGTKSDRQSATEQLARFLGFNAMQGALTAGIAALATKGLFGLDVARHEAQDDPLAFMAESYMASMGGPMYLMWRGVKEKGLMGIGDDATRMVFPYTIATDLRDMVDGRGQYRDLDTFTKIGRFIQSKTPGLRPLQLGASLVGLSERDLKLEAAAGAFYRWHYETFKREHQGTASSDAFRTAMKKAVSALKKGDQDAYVEAYMEAAEISAADGEQYRDRIASSFRARKMLKNPDGEPLTATQIESLRNQIGGDAYDRLQYFDIMLDRAADGAWTPPQD